MRVKSARLPWLCCSFCTYIHQYDFVNYSSKYLESRIDVLWISIFLPFHPDFAEVEIKNWRWRRRCCRLSLSSTVPSLTHLINVLIYRNLFDFWLSRSLLEASLRSTMKLFILLTLWSHRKTAAKIFSVNSASACDKERAAGREV